MKTSDLNESGNSANQSPIKISLQQDSNFPYHWHDYLEIILVLKGSIKLYALTSSADLKEGDLEILNFNELHRIVGNRDNLVLSLKIKAEFAESLIPGIEKSTFDSLLVSHSKSKYREIAALGRMLIEKGLLLMESGMEINRQARKHIKEILLYLMENFEIISHALKAREIGGEEREVLRARYRRIINYIFTNSSKKIGLQEIAERENLSLYHLSHEIKKLLGENFQELMNHQRIHMAMKLLLSTSLNVTEIAYDCGYSAPRYLHHYFKKLLNTTPIEFRNHYKCSLSEIESQLKKGEQPFSQIVPAMKAYKQRSALSVQPVHLAIDWNQQERKDPAPAFQKRPDFFKNPPLTPGKMNPDPLEDSMLAGVDWLHKIMSSDDGDTNPGELYQQNGLKRPYWFVHYALSLLGDRVLERGENYLLTSGGDALQILLFPGRGRGYPGKSFSSGDKSVNFRIRMKNLKENGLLTRFWFREDNCSLYFKWNQMGRPQSLSWENLVLLDKILHPEVDFEKTGKSLSLDVPLTFSSFLLITLE